MISSVGLLVVDLTFEVDHLPQLGESIDASALTRSLGGKAANQIVAATRLGAPTSFIGTVGAPDKQIDPVWELQQEGVNVEHVHRSEHDNGVSAILLEPGGGQFIVTHGGPGFHLNPTTVLAALGQLGTKILLLQGETNWSETREVAIGFGGTVILDPSPVSAFSGVDLSFVDILTPNAVEAAMLCLGAASSAAEVRRRTGAECVVVTRGSHGVEIADQQGTVTFSAPKIITVDPTGAGDAFSGALAAAIHAGATIREAAEFAVQMAAISVSRMHCIPSYPTLSELPEGIKLPRALHR